MRALALAGPHGHGHGGHHGGGGWGRRSYGYSTDTVYLPTDVWYYDEAAALAAPPVKAPAPGTVWRVRSVGGQYRWMEVPIAQAGVSGLGISVDPAKVTALTIATILGIALFMGFKKIRER